MTLIICYNDQCIHAKQRGDKLFQCACTTIGINKKNECDFYMVLPMRHLNKVNADVCSCNVPDIIYTGKRFCCKCNKQVE